MSIIPITLEVNPVTRDRTRGSLSLGSIKCVTLLVVDLNYYLGSPRSSLITRLGYTDDRFRS